ncbi:MAG TPA: ABC transporter permease [Acidimicrobiales bacterium]|nr:ABC transporter permease [Acidimicrobiales bacterium]
MSADARPTRASAVAAIAGNEVRRLVRDRVALLFVVLLPTAIILLIGSTFGAAEGLDVGVIDRDGTAESRALVDGLRDTEGVDVYHDEGNLRRDIRTGVVSAGVVIPDGYGKAVDAGDDATVTLVADPTSTSAAAVQAGVRATVGDRAAVVAAGRAAAGEGADPGAVASARQEAAALAPDTPEVGVRTVTVDDGGEAALGDFDYTAPSNLVLFTFVNTLVAGTALARERRQGITRRMLATPHGTGTILLGLGASKLAVALLQSAVIVVIGAVLFDVPWGDPMGVGLLILTFALVATFAGLFVGAIATDQEQAASIATPIAIALGMLGGCMWPLFLVPPIMRAAGHLTPQAWAMDAWVTLIWDRGGVAAIAGPLAVLAGFAVALGVLATWRLRRSLTA